MSKARSPREVCSTTIGINGLIGSLTSPCCRGSTDFFSVVCAFFLAGRPDALARVRPAPARSASPRRRSGRLPSSGADRGERGRRRPLDMNSSMSSSLSPSLAQLGADLVVGDLDARACRRPPRARARGRSTARPPSRRRCSSSAPLMPVALQVGGRVDPARLELADEARSAGRACASRRRGPPARRSTP